MKATKKRKETGEPCDVFVFGAAHYIADDWRCMEAKSEP
jgi:hypothetical protein